MDKKIRKGCYLAAAFAGTYGISYLMSFRDTREFSFSVVTVFLMTVLYFLYQQTMGKTRKNRGTLFSVIISLVMGLSLVMGYQLQAVGLTEGGVTGVLKNMLRGVCVGTAVFPLASLFFHLIGEKNTKLQITVQSQKRGYAKAFLCSWLGIWLSWFPVWLAYYPVIMSYDFHSQSLQLFVNNIYDRQPVTHTVLIGMFRTIGAAIGSYETALAMFCQMQQMILSAVLAYAVVMIYRLAGRRKWAIVSAVLFAIFPVISVFAMCTTKDVMFSTFFVLFLLLFIERLYFTESKKKKMVVEISLVPTGILMILFRNNAWHAIAATGVLLLILGPRREKMRIFIISAAIIAGGPLIRTGIEKSVDASHSPGVEPYSVIIQCFARVGYLHQDTMPQETYELINTYISAEKWADYNPVISDNLKAYVEHHELEEGTWDDMSKVIAAWVKVGLQYPYEYLDAILDLTRGYWFLDDTSHAEMLGTEEGMGLLYTYNSYEPAAFEGMEASSKWIWLKDKLERLLTQNCYYDVPVLSNLFKPAVWCWAFILTIVTYLYRREKRNLMIAAYPLLYFGTLLLGPTAIIRYVIPYILTVPVMLALIGKPLTKSVEETQTTS